MAARNVLVIGANRGLGLGLLKTFKERGYKVFGTVRPQTRSDPSYKERRQLEATGATIIDLDYLEEGSIAAAAKSYGNDQVLDVLVNCGGIEMYPENWLDTTAESLVFKFRVMTVVGLVTPVPITKYLDGSADLDEANDCGTHISYRVPKSALNALSISVAIELKAAKKNIAVLCIDPGDVPTKLSRWAGDIDLNDSVRGMYEQIEKATIEDTGLFVNWRGHKWPY
ncbi:hypothetical protein O1611_g21 [Lasiodiplodia mahajangana]|uniref:Uncharacterized protein n=1 Tax=Lasiodiplodia mahajangana TaxID=1108764 RepID=A0ACC2K242_9PEZI|nr:hypothetical protein O1611_g21 [Lasiodiplodia mahajangana]